MDTIKLKFDFPVLVTQEGFNMKISRIIEVVCSWEFEPIMHLYVPFEPDKCRFILEKGNELNIDCDSSVMFQKRIKPKGGVKNESD